MSVKIRPGTWALSMVIGVASVLPAVGAPEPKAPVTPVKPAPAKPTAPAKVAPAKGTPAPDDARFHQTLGGTNVSANELEYDLKVSQMTFVGAVEILMKDTRITANRTTVQLTKKQTIDWSKSEGNVVIEKTNPDDGSKMVARGPVMEYSETEQKSNLQGGVVVKQSSSRLSQPSVITGSRVDMDLKTHVNVVVRSSGAQAKVHVEPKGEEGKQTPEPVDLTADRIEMNSDTQEYVATGSPVVEKPSGRMQARKIRFTVDEKTNDIRVAYADEDVIFDSTAQNGTVTHATGDHGRFDQNTNEIILEGNVVSNSRKPTEVNPTVMTGDKFVYNRATQKANMYGHAQLVLPDQATEPKASDDAASVGAKDKKNGKDGKPGLKPAPKPEIKKDAQGK